ncbi:hypothetical protein Tco_0998764 [Tanacetum coccineum]
MDLLGDRKEGRRFQSLDHCYSVVVVDSSMMVRVLEILLLKEKPVTAGDAGEFALMGVSSENINAIAETAKKELQTKLDNHLVQIEKWRTSSKNLFRLIDSSMSVRTKVGLGFNNYIRENELGWDDSAFSVFTTNSEEVDITIDLDESQIDKSSEVNTNDFASSDSSVKSSEPKSNDFNSCASTSRVSTSESEAEIESITHLIKDYDFYEKQMTNKTVGNRMGPVHSRNNVNHQNQFVPQAVLLRTGKVNILLLDHN